MSQSDAAFDRLDKQYSEEVEPYQSIVEAIALQNKLIYELQSKHKELTRRQEQLKKESVDQKWEEEFKSSRRQELRQERNVFFLQALQIRQRDYEEAFSAKKKERLQQIYFKYQHICQLRKDKQNTTSIFTHINDEMFSSGKGRGHSSIVDE